MAAKRFTTADAYTDANGIRSQVPQDRITVAVQNAEVTAQFVIVDDPGRPVSAFPFNSTEIPGLSPGVWNFTPADFNGFQMGGVQVRSSVAGAPAIVTVHA